MEQIIQQLVDARKNKGLSLEELHRLTKIPLGQLEAMEQYNFAKIGPEVYLRGFIRRYAKEVGLDGDQLLGTQVQPPQVKPSPVIKMRKRKETSFLPALASILGILAIVGLAGWLIFVGITALRQAPPDLPPDLPDTGLDPGDPQDPAQPDPEPDPDPAPLEPEVVLADTQGTRVYDVFNVEQLEISLSFLGPCWVQARVNGVTVDNGTTYRTGQLEWQGEIVWIRLGAARNAIITVNGVELERLAEDVVNFEFRMATRDDEGEEGQ